MALARRILFASDFSKGSRRAHATAVEMAKVHRATLVLVHVIPPITPIAPEEFVQSSTWTQIEMQGRRWAEQQLAKLAEKTRQAGVQVTTVLAEGDAASQIVRAARARRVGFIVVGTHGRSGLARLLVGSVAARVVATAPCPVVTVRGT